MKSAAAASNEALSLSEKAYRLLESELVTLRLWPGQLVSEKELVSQLGIGRTPVREAIQRLSSEGLFEVMPRKGLLVTPLRRSDLGRIIEARRVLERLLVVKAAERAKPEQRAALRGLAQELRSAQGDVDRFFVLDRRLNAMLESACDNRFLVSALNAMHSQCRRLWYNHRDELDLVKSAVMHSGLANAVAEGDAASAIRASDEIIAILEGLLSSMDVLS